jgi:hypothetical protein
VTAEATKGGCSRIFAVEDRHAVRDLAISDAKPIVMVALRAAGGVAAMSP